ncbi:MAG: hypothetical protein HYW65_01450 [Candidatus Liptonbacteria bacterium]|nr:hypothetical protein [Candidatus Liptonbacteria bacterium]
MQTDDLRALLAELLVKAESTRRSAAEVEMMATRALGLLDSPVDSPEKDGSDVKATGFGSAVDIEATTASGATIAAVNREAEALTTNVPPQPPATPIPGDAAAEMDTNPQQNATAEEPTRQVETAEGTVGAPEPETPTATPEPKPEEEPVSA